jgi:hypothetical protein
MPHAPSPREIGCAAPADRTAETRARAQETTASVGAGPPYRGISFEISQAAIAGCVWKRPATAAANQACSATNDSSR